MSLPSRHIADIRKDYRRAALDEAAVGDDPFAFFEKWFSEAVAADAEEVNAMTLATVDAQGAPHARIVLLKGVDEGGFIFFTNYQSAKGRDLEAVPRAALVFFWRELERQVRVEGVVEKVSDSESDQYFHSRPAESRIGAWASPQSQTIADRSILEENQRLCREQFADGGIPRPPHWGGFRVIPLRIEFWQGRSSRLHDRILFSRESQTAPWQRSRLAP
mgnify:CR=1 FL=1